MGKIKTAIEFMESDAFTDALNKPFDALDKALTKLEAKNKEELEKFFKCLPGEKALLISHLYSSSERQNRFYINVYDSPDNVKYTVKDEKLSAKHHLHIFDSTGKEIGFVKEKLITFRPSAIMQVNPIDFDFKINGKKVATLKSRRSFKTTKFSMSNGWEIEGDFFGTKYCILSEGRIIGNVNRKLWSDKYFLTFSECEDELLLLMVALAMDIDTSPKRPVEEY